MWQPACCKRRVCHCPVVCSMLGRNLGWLAGVCMRVRVRVRECVCELSQVHLRVSRGFPWLT